MRYPHGTRTAYNLDRCRCTECTKANREYLRQYEARPLRNRGDIDDIAVQRYLEGDRTIRLTDAERYEIIRRWDGPTRHLIELTGWNVYRMRRQMKATTA